MSRSLGYPTAAFLLALVLALFIGESPSEHVPPQPILPAVHAAHAATAEAPGDFEQFTYTGAVSRVQALGDRVWVGTYGGLVELESGTRRFLRLYTVADGLPDLACSDIRAIGDALWIAGPAGLVCFDPGTCRFEVVDPTPVGRLVHGPERRVLWALDHNRGATRVDLATGDVRTWPEIETDGSRIVDDEFWTVGGREEGGPTVRCKEPLTGQTRATNVSGICDTEPRLSPGGRSVWVTFDSHYSKGPGIGRIERESGRLRVYRDDHGLPGSFVPYAAGQGDDLWAACFTSHIWQRYLGGGLARFNAGTGEWQRHPSISGARFDAPTAIRALDGNLWAATQGYDETREMIVGWSMSVLRHEAPVVKHLALSRWLPATQTWEVHRFPAEHNYGEITDFWMTTDDIWMAISRTDTAKSSHGPDEPKGTWLASCPRAGGDLAWHFPLTEISEGDEYAHQIENVYVADDTIWVYQRGKLQHYDPKAASMCEAEWPCPLPAYNVQAIAAADDQVWLGTNDGRLLDLDRARGIFKVDARVMISGREQSSWRGTTGPDTRRELQPPEPSSPWGPAETASIISAVCGRNGDLWVNCAGKSGYFYLDDPMRIDRTIPCMFAPAGLLRRSGGSWTVPDVSAWSIRHRKETGRNQFVPASQPDRMGISLWLAFLEFRGHGEPGTACVLPEEGRLWLGTLGDGLYALEGEHWRRLGPLPPEKPPPPPDPTQPPEGWSGAAHVARPEQQASLTARTGRRLGGSQTLEFRPDDLVVALARAGDVLYVATAGHLYHYAIPEGEWDRIGPRGFAPAILDRPSERHVGLNAIRGGRGCFLVELDGDLWMPGRIGEEHQGLYRLRAGHDEVELALGQRPLAAVAHEGRLWVCTGEGLIRLDPATGEQRVLQSLGSRSSPDVAAIAAEGDALWVCWPRVVTRLTVAEFERRAEPLSASPD